MQGVSGDDTAFELQQGQSLLCAQRLVAARRQALTDHQSGLGCPDIDQMQRRGLAATLIGPPHRLAVDRHNPLQRPAERCSELRESRLKWLRLEQAEDPAERVM